MKNYRSLLLALSALLIVTAPVVQAANETRPEGPPPGARRERMEKGGERMAEALGLNEDQKLKMKAIAEQEDSERQALRADTALAKEDLKARTQAIREKYKAQRDAILTPEQKAKADQFREKGRERMEKRQERREKSGL